LSYTDLIIRIIKTRGAKNEKCRFDRFGFVCRFDNLHDLFCRRFRRAILIFPFNHRNAFSPIKRAISPLRPSLIKTFPNFSPFRFLKQPLRSIVAPIFHFSVSAKAFFHHRPPTVVPSISHRPSEKTRKRKAANAAFLLLLC